MLPVGSAAGAAAFVDPEVDPDVRVSPCKRLETGLQIGEIAQRQVGDEQDLVGLRQQLRGNQRRRHVVAGAHGGLEGTVQAADRRFGMVANPMALPGIESHCLLARQSHCPVPIPDLFTNSPCVARIVCRDATSGAHFAVNRRKKLQQS
jgi:hypothetical protein